MDRFLLAIVVFIVLTLIHPLIDFLNPHRKWRGEFWLALNPLHALWDISSFRKHQKYVVEGKKISMFLLDLHETERKQYRKTYERPYDDVQLRKHARNLENAIVVNRSFWWWLGVDQFAHVILNIIWAFFVYINLIFLAISITMPVMGFFYTRSQNRRGNG